MSLSFSTIFNSCFCGRDSVIVKSRKYYIKDVIGEGGFSTVYLVENNENGRVYAVKKIICHSIEDQEVALNEINVHEKIHHENIIKLVDYEINGSPDPVKNYTSQVYLVLPYYRRGTLHQELEKRSSIKKPFTPIQVLEMFLKICSGVKAFHQCQEPMAHRDLKTANILLDADDTPIIMDLVFGRVTVYKLLACILNANIQGENMNKHLPVCEASYLEPVIAIQYGLQHITFLTHCTGTVCILIIKPEKFTYGICNKPHSCSVLSRENKDSILHIRSSAALARVTINSSSDAQNLQDLAAERCSMPYRAPELFNVENHTVIDERTDIWSLGCILYAMCFFKSPYDIVYERGDSVALAVLNGVIKFPEEHIYGKDMEDLIMFLLKVNPSERPYIENVIEKVETTLKKYSVSV